MSNAGPTHQALAAFHQNVWEYYELKKRDFPWRRTLDPYRILVSEIMLQQTQTHRVKEKYKHFLSRFPSIHCLADASLRDVFLEWRGLGYNRRARFLRQAAEVVCNEYHGRIPRDFATLRSLPGVGPYTASAIRVFAFNQGDVLIETNIRAAVIDFFFPGKKKVSDRQLLPILQALLPRGHAREWYSALMDYGAALKRRQPALTRRSAGYSRQSRFQGSFRQLRAKLLHLVAERGALRERDIPKSLGASPHSPQLALEALIREGSVVRKAGVLQIAGTSRESGSKKGERATSRQPLRLR